MIIRARMVVTMDGPPIKNGAVAISKIKSSMWETFQTISKMATPMKKIVDLGEQAVLPGLINAHCHLDYTCLRGKIPPQKSFADWIRAINAKRRSFRKGITSRRSVKFRGGKKIRHDDDRESDRVPELISQIQAPVRTWWFAELIDVRDPVAQMKLSICHQIAESGNGLRVAGSGSAPHALFTAREICTGVARIRTRDQILLTTHLAESREEMEMFREGSGPLYEFMKSIGRPMDDCGRETPLRFLAAPGGRALPPLDRRSFKRIGRKRFRIAQRKRQINAMWCIPLEVTIIFGTADFPSRNCVLLGSIFAWAPIVSPVIRVELFAEMRAFQRSEPEISPDKILEMVTVNPGLA